MGETLGPDANLSERVTYDADPSAKVEYLVDFLQWIAYHGGEVGLVFHEAPGLTRVVSRAEAEVLARAWLDLQSRNKAAEAWIQ